jgi:hypothetical protein
MSRRLHHAITRRKRRVHGPHPLRKPHHGPHKPESARTEAHEQSLRHPRARHHVL